MVLTLVLIFAATALAQKAPAPDATRPGPYAFEMQTTEPPLQAIENGMVNRNTGTVVSLVNQNAGPFSGSAEQAARTYLSSRAQDFGIVNAEQGLLLEGVRKAPGGTHVTFRQAIGGVPVWRAEVVVSLDSSEQLVRAVSCSYDPLLPGSGMITVPALTEAQAMDRALAAVGISDHQDWMGDPTIGLWIVRDHDVAGSPGHLAWRVTLPVQEPMGDWVVCVDAGTGAIVRLVDQELFVDGSGYAFDPDPLTTAEVNYGGNYSDLNDADTAELNAERFLRTLPELTFSGGLYYLRGPWVYIDEFESPVSPPATSPDPNGFTFTRSQQGFEDVNAYFHIDQSQRYMRSLGFTNIQAAPIHVDTHGLNGADNSHYIPSTNRIAWGEGGVDDAEDADVLLHEYGHAIQHSIRPGWGGGQEGSMGEGFGDYWACSYSASISSFRDYWVFNWDGHNPFWPGRVVNSSLGYNNINGDIYHDGTIWASVWWLIRAEMGRIVSDTDMLKLHYYMGTSGTMAQAAAYAMQSDKDLYEGLHAGTLDYYFVLRSFLTASQFDVPVLTHTPLPDTVAAPGPYPVTVTVASTSPVVAGSVKVKYGTGEVFDQEVVLDPTGNPNEWGGFIPDVGENVSCRYYIIADNTATWRGASPRGAEFRYHSFFAKNSASVGDHASNRALVLRVTSPNPARNLASLVLELPQRGEARLELFDLSGRLVRTLASGELEAGSHAYLWDGRNDAGQSAGAGLYFARATAGGQTLTQKVMLMK